MIDWIRSWFCDHKWRRVSHGNLRDPYYSSAIIGNYEHFICDKCLKKKQVEWV